VVSLHLIFDILQSTLCEDIMEPQIRCCANFEGSEEMSKGVTFGEYMLHRRKSLGMSARELAIASEISAVYICDMEKSNRPAPTDEKLERLVRALRIADKEEKALFYDLAAKSKNSVSKDLPDYIMEKDIVRAAQRVTPDTLYFLRGTRNEEGEDNHA